MDKDSIQTPHKHNVSNTLSFQISSFRGNLIELKGLRRNAHGPAACEKERRRDGSGERRGKGKILNITSQAAFNGSTTGHSHYAAAKSGVVTFTISMSRELAPKGINVNALALGMVETQMNQDILATNREYYEKRIQIGRIAKPVEVARFAVFLVSGCADYFTGATYDATGGMITR